MKFQVTQPIASLIINKWFQLLPLLGHWLYRLVSTPIHPWLYSSLFLEKPLGLTFLGRGLPSIGTSGGEGGITRLNGNGKKHNIFFLKKPHPITLQRALAERELSFTQVSWNPPSPTPGNYLHWIINTKPSFYHSQLLAKFHLLLVKFWACFTVSTGFLDPYWFLRNGVRSEGTTILHW